MLPFHINSAQTVFGLTHTLMRHSYIDDNIGYFVISSLLTIILTSWPPSHLTNQKQCEGYLIDYAHKEKEY